MILNQASVPIPTNLNSDDSVLHHGLLWFSAVVPKVAAAATKSAKGAGKLAVNSFVRLEKRFDGRIPYLEVSDYGDATVLLESRVFFKQQAQMSLKRGSAGDQS